MTATRLNPVSGVKGNAESSYRTGDVNITQANIGITYTNGSATKNSNANSGAFCYWRKYGRIVQCDCWATVASAHAASTDKTYFTGLPKPVSELTCGTLAISGGVAVARINSSGSLIVQTRSTAIAANNEFYGSFIYVSAS